MLGVVDDAAVMSDSRVDGTETESQNSHFINGMLIKYSRNK